MADLNYRTKLEDDLLEQFRGKRKISVVIDSFARQLQEVFGFLNGLLFLLDIDACTGNQLDLLGEIVALSRYDARVMAGETYEGEVLNDELYRKLIKYKILLNTSDCTYWSIMKGVKMFWDKTPIYYEEDPETPATIILSTPVLSPEINPRDLIEMPVIRPAGVDFRLYATTETHVSSETVRMAGAVFRGVTSSELPEMGMDYGLVAKAPIIPALFSISQTPLGEIINMEAWQW